MTANLPHHKALDGRFLANHDVYVTKSRRSCVCRTCLIPAFSYLFDGGNRNPSTAVLLRVCGPSPSTKAPPASV